MSSFPVYTQLELNFSLPRLCPSFCVGLFWCYLLFSLSPVLFILSYLFSPEPCLSFITFSMLFSVLLHVLLNELDVFSINTSPNCFTLPSPSAPLLLVSFTLPSLHFSVLLWMLLLSSPLPPHLLSVVAGCCECEEGRCSNSQMCESAESKAVSLTHSSLQVQDIAALCANVILLTNGIQSNFMKSYFSSSVISIQQICFFFQCKVLKPLILILNAVWVFLSTNSCLSLLSLILKYYTTVQMFVGLKILLCFWKILKFTKAAFDW